MYPYLLELKKNGYSETSLLIPKLIGKPAVSEKKIDVLKTMSNQKDNTFMFSLESKSNCNEEKPLISLGSNCKQDMTLINSGIVQSKIDENNYMSNFIDSLRMNSVAQQTPTSAKIMMDNFMTNQNLMTSYPNQNQLMSFRNQNQMTSYQNQNQMTSYQNQNQMTSYPNQDQMIPNLNQLKLFPQLNSMVDAQNLLMPRNMIQNQSFFNKNTQSAVMLKNSLDMIQKQIMKSNMESVENMWFNILNSNLKIHHQCNKSI